MEYELYHHGVMGMKWGIRRYQNKDGTLTSAGQKRYNKELEKLKAEEKVLKNKQATASKLKKLEDLEKSVSDRKNALKGKHTEDEDNDDYEVRKQQAIKSGSASEALRFKGDLTQQEMQYIQSRIQWEQNMKNVSNAEINAGKSKVNDAVAKLEKATDYANKGIKAYNTIANIYNAFSKSSISLPKIDTDIIKGNKELRKKEKKYLDDMAKKEKAEQKKAEDAAKREQGRRDYENYQTKLRNDQASAERRNLGNYRVHGSNLTDPVFKTGRSKIESVVDHSGTLLLSAPSTRENITLGQTYIAGLLPAPKDD